MHRLFRQGSLPVCPHPHARWGGICLHEATRPSGDAEQVALPEKIKNTNLIRPQTVHPLKWSLFESVMTESILPTTEKKTRPKSCCHIRLFVSQWAEISPCKATCIHRNQSCVMPNLTECSTNRFKTPRPAPLIFKRLLWFFIVIDR